MEPRAGNQKRIEGNSGPHNLFFMLLQTILIFVSVASSGNSTSDGLDW